MRRTSPKGTFAVAAFAAAFAVLSAALPAQGPPPNGPRTVDPGWHALTNAVVVPSPGQRLEGATVVVKDGRIVSVERSAPPAGARVHDCTGLVLYAGLVEPFLPVDAPAPDADAPGVHWSPMVLPQRSALDGDGVPAAERETLRELGFAAAAIAPTGGVLKGTAALVLLDEPEAGARARVLREHAYETCSFQSRDGYPSSEMGAIALLRQTLHDAEWYERCTATVAAMPPLASRSPQPSAAFAALAAHRALPLAFDVDDELQALRAAKVAAEFGRTAIVLGSGMEFRRLQALAAAKVAIVAPLRFPDAPDVATIAKAERTSLRHLQSWEHAPANSKRLADAGVTVAWTTARLRDKKDFRARAADAIACGLSKELALAAVTTVPASLLGAGDRLGTIEPGKVANLVAVAGDLFDPDAEIRAVWVGGVKHETKAGRAAPAQALDGEWSWTSGAPALDPAAAAKEGAKEDAKDGAKPAGAATGPPLLRIDGDTVTAVLGGTELRAKGVSRSSVALDFHLAGKALAQQGTFLFHARRDGAVLVGDGRAPDGAAFTWRAERKGPLPKAAAAKPEGKDEEPREGEGAEAEGKGRAKKRKPFTPPALGPLPVPLGGYGFVERPAAQSFALVHATLWTCEDAGIVRRGAVVVSEGRIVYAGPVEGMPALPEGTLRIECDGKHVTPGLIDCHSHTGISRGLNESGQAVSAEVRVQDVIDPGDVNWYRQLAGGVTAVNQLHGSANAIGGQSSTVKVRWGALDPEELRLEGAPAGIKFALGENPRRANSSGENERYPNTRMGVESLIRDRFQAAVEYGRRMAEYEELDPRQRASVMPPRRDLELEALAEVLAGTRRIHCHSYRQDEIFMLCQLAGEYGIKVGTFQHVLEGYKVAEAIAKSAVGASSFSDWWAYKFEVYDAIPDNGAILRDAGVVVSFNSDSNELARRLNTEAGKAVKYGGVPPHEALKFVSLNPAIQLGVQHRTGSLKPGKDADLALWSGDPLRYSTRCEATWVDGRQLFSLARDREHRAWIAAERQRLLQKALAAGGAPERRAADDAQDAYWRAEDLTEDYCCRDCEEGRR